MYLQEILEVAIGLIFLWLVVSVAVMQLMEWFATARGWRSVTLKSTIRQMLADDGLTEKLYQHPLITTLFTTKRGGKIIPPAFIPANKFALALFDLAVSAGTEASPILSIMDSIKEELDKQDDPEKKKLAKDDWDTITTMAKQVASSRLGEEAVDSVKSRIREFGEQHPDLVTAIDGTMDQLDSYYQDFLSAQRMMAPSGLDKDQTLRQVRLGVLTLDALFPKSNIRKSLGALLTGVEEYVKEGEQALALARTNVESWFNDAMDRLTGIYKRKVQFASFFMGLAIALLLNVDSITVATTLWREPTLRQAFIAQADATVQKNSDGVEIPATNPINTVGNLQSELKVLNLPFGWVSDPIVLDASLLCTLSTPTTYDDSGNLTHILGIHIGNTCYPITNAPAFNVDNWLSWLVKILGFAISGAAAAQGAPFWFDILKKLVNVRSTGPKPNEE